MIADDARITTRCIVVRRADTGDADDYGAPGRVETYSLSRCRLDPVDGSETVEGAEIDVRRVMVRSSAGDLQANDGLVVSSALDAVEDLDELTSEDLGELVGEILGAGTGELLEFTAQPVTLRDATMRVRHIEATVRRAS